MPVPVSYPGVYLEEIPSGVRSITGVATAVTAFVGRTRRGRTDEAKRIYSWAEYEREYGGLWKDSSVSYAVNHYFANGGTDAVIARAQKGGASATYAYPASDTLALTAANGLNYRLVVTHPVDPNDVASFTLVVQPAGGGAALAIYSLSLDPASANYLPDVIGAASTAFVKMVDDDDVPLNRPDAGTTDMTGGTVAAAAVAATITLTVTAGTAMILTAKTAGAAGNSLTAEVLNDGLGGLTLTLSDGVTPETHTTANYAADPAAFAADVASGVYANVTQDASAAPDTAAPATFTGGLNEVLLVASTATLTGLRGTSDAVTLTACSAGEWGNNLRVSVDYNTKDPSDTDLFNLVVVEVDPDQPTVEVRRETFRNLSVDPGSSRYAETVIEQESNLVRLSLGTGDVRPSPASGLELDTGGDGSVVTSTEILEGLDLLETVDLFTLLCIPPLDLATDIDLAEVGATAIDLCNRRNAFFIVDGDSGWMDADAAADGVDGWSFAEKNAAVYFPRLKMPDPLKEYRLNEFAPCGVVAGIMARTDAQRGVWKAPAGLEANTRGVKELTVKLTDAQQGTLNQLGINCLRTFPVAGTVVWGARTMRGADALADEWKYVPVRRMANYLRESLARGTKWAVFEPNDEPLWAQIRLAIGSFMQTLFRQGAFQGKTPREAYFVKCDKETTTQADINLGIVNILVGFAPLKPAEFVIIKLQQMAGQSG